MPNFRYRARDAAGRSVDGLLTAEDERQLAAKLGEMNLVLVESRPFRTEKERLVSGRVKRRDLILFTNHLATSLEAGIPLVTAMQDYASELDNPRLKQIVEDVVRQVLAGTTLTDALSKHPRVFTEMYVSVISTGEATGNLDRTLRDLVGFLEWQEELAGQIRQASIYPAFLIGMIVVVIVIMMVVTVPKFLPLLTSFNVELPAPTRILIGVSNFFQHYALHLALFFALLAVVYKFSNRSPDGRLFWDRVKLGVPLFGKLQLKIVLSKFAHYFSMLFSSGIGILEAFIILQRVVGNEVVRRALVRANESIEKGGSIYDALSREAFFPPLVLRMIQVGESTGTLDSSLEKASQYYDREVPATIKKIFAAFEPMLIMVMGGAVLFMALAIFLPIYRLTSTIGSQR